MKLLCTILFVIIILLSINLQRTIKSYLDLKIRESSKYCRTNKKVNIKKK